MSTAVPCVNNGSLGFRGVPCRVPLGVWRRETPGWVVSQVKSPTGRSLGLQLWAIALPSLGKGFVNRFLSGGGFPLLRCQVSFSPPPDQPSTVSSSCLTLVDFPSFVF